MGDAPVDTARAETNGSTAMNGSAAVNRADVFRCVAGGVLLGFSYPPSPAPYLALVAWVPLLVAWRHADSARTSLFYGVCFYTACFGIAFSWPLGHAYASVAAASFLPLVLLVLALSVPLGLSRIVATGVRPSHGVLAFVAIHLLVEAALSRGPFALPWPLAGNALAEADAIRGLAALGGVSLLSAWVLLVNGTLFVLLRATPAAHMRTGAVLVVVLIAGYAGARFALPDVVAGEGRHVALVQPALPATEWADVESRHRVDVLVQMTDSLYRSERVRPDLTVWPETALPPCPGPPLCTADRARLAASSGGHLPPLLTGAITGTSEDAPHAPWHNSALLVDGDVRARYDKVRLVPFAEGVPFANQLPALAVLGIHAGGVSAYAPGSPGMPVDVGNWRVGTLICFESLFPQDARRYARLGADVLVVTSQDGWWGRSAGHAQHLAFTRFRAVESGRPVVFVSASGRSAVIAPDGRVTSSIPYGVRSAVVAAVPAYRGATLYVRYGDWVSVVAAVIIVLLVIHRTRRRKAQRGG